MRVNTGRTWVDLGPASATGGLVGHRSAFTVALSDTTILAPSARVALRCAICGEPTTAGRMYCSPEHSKLGYGNRA